MISQQTNAESKQFHWYWLKLAQYCVGAVLYIEHIFNPSFLVYRYQLKVEISNTVLHSNMYLSKGNDYQQNIVLVLQNFREFSVGSI